MLATWTRTRRGGAVHLFPPDWPRAARTIVRVPRFRPLCTVAEFLDLMPRLEGFHPVASPVL